MKHLSRRTTIPQELEDHEDCIVSGNDDDDGDDADHETDSTMLRPTSSPVSQQVTATYPTAAVPASEKEIVLLWRTWRNEIMKWPKEMRNLIAGGIAGMAAKSVVAPLDRIKILYQVSAAEFRLSHLPRVAHNIVQNEGLSALWKGNSATMVRIFPYSGIQFMVFDRIKSYFLHQHEVHRSLYANTGDRKHHKWGLTPTESLVAGMAAGTASVICTYPLDLTRAQLAVLRKHPHGGTKGFVSILTENYSKRGIGGLFRGMTPTLLGILPYAGISFTLNEQSKREIQYLSRRDLTTIEKMLCGALAGLVAQSITYPIEVIRRRMQVLGLVGNDTAFANLGVTISNPPPIAGQPQQQPQQLQRALPKAIADQPPPTLKYVIQSLYAEQGWRGFVKGVSVNWMKGPIAFAISFTIFDLAQGLMATDAERVRRQPQRFRTIRKDHTT